MKKRNLIIIVLVLSIITIFLGISVAMFSYLGQGTTNNVIQTGRIVFSYSDAELGTTQGNGINITNALPISDSSGKLLSSPSEYFDFSVSASTTSVDLAYEIVVDKQSNSTLDEDNVKIYLTEFNGTTEQETEITGGLITPTYASLNDTDNSLLEGKTVYYGNVLAGEIAYRKDFRLRMWIKDVDNLEESNNEATNLNLEEEKEFTVKVNVAAVGNN